jgi:hypothetical protein
VKLLRRCLKALAWLALALLALAAALLAWVAAINRHDEPLSDAAQAALRYAPPGDQALQGNGYLIVAGLDAPAEPGHDAAATELGRQWLAREAERWRWVEAHGDDNAAALPAAISLKRGALDLWPAALRCPTGHTDCLDWYAAHRAEVTALLHSQQALMQRLAAAASAPRFSNDAPHYLLAEMPPYQRLRDGHALWLAQAALQWTAGQPQQALATVRQAARLRQRLAGSAGHLVEAMVALATHYRELRWLSQASARLPSPAPAALASDIEALLATPPPSLRPALEGEKQFMASVLHSIKGGKGAGWLIAPDDAPAWWPLLADQAAALAYLPRQTLNMTIDSLQQAQAMSELPAHQIEHAFASHGQRWQDAHACGLPWVRNMVGNCMAAITLPGYERYPLRVADIDGFRRLALAHHRARVQGVSPADMPGWLARTPQALHDPYTQAPMQWDAATHSLVFEGRQKQNQNPGGTSTYRIGLAPPPARAAGS